MQIARAFINTAKFNCSLFSTAAKRSEKMQKLRETDYAKKRKQAIDNYNLRLHQEKASYNSKYRLFEEKRDALQSDKEAQDLQTSFEQYLDVYNNNTQALSDGLKKQLDQINLQEKTDIVKIYLMDNLPEEQVVLQNSSKKSGFYIPNRLILKKLYHGTRDKAKDLHPSRQILLAGVETQEQHSLFLSKLIDEMNIKNIVTMVSPDLPYFIKTERSYIQEWTKFIENNDYAKKCKFYINPQPKTLEDICLHQTHIPLVRRGLSRSRTFLENYYCMMKENDITKIYEPAPLLTGFLSQNIKRIYFGNYPAFEERRMIADHTSLGKLRELFQLHLRNFKLGKFNFSAQWLFPKEVLAKKLTHLISVTRAAVESTNERTLLICSAEMAELLSIEWQLSKGKLNYNYQDGNYYFNLSHRLQGGQSQSFMEFIEKLVILDLIMQPIFTRYFIKYRSFPFLCEHTIGGTQNIGKIFAVWMHFYNTYFSLLTEKRLQSDAQMNQRKQYMNQFEDPTNFT